MQAKKDLVTDQTIKAVKDKHHKVEADSQDQKQAQ